MTYQVTGLTFGFLCCPTLTQCVADSEGRRQGRSQELRIFTQATRLHGKISKTANFGGQFLFVGKIKTCLLSLLNIFPSHQPWHVFDMLQWISYQLQNSWGCWSESLKSIDYHFLLVVSLFWMTNCVCWHWENQVEYQARFVPYQGNIIGDRIFTTSVSPFNVYSLHTDLNVDTYVFYLVSNR